MKPCGILKVKKCPGKVCVRRRAVHHLQSCWLICQPGLYIT